MYIGSYVCDRHGNTGTIIETYANFWELAKTGVTMTGEEWLEAQIIPFTEEQIAEPWAKVHCEHSGISSPFSLLEELNVNST